MDSLSRISQINGPAVPLPFLASLAGFVWYMPAVPGRTVTGSIDGTVS